MINTINDGNLGAQAHEPDAIEAERTRQLSLLPHHVQAEILTRPGGSRALEFAMSVVRELEKLEKGGALA
jgi:hypothetical protein